MPKSTRELTTVYTGLSSNDFARFSALAEAKKLSRSELAREAIKFYLAWQGQLISWDDSNPVAQLLQKMNSSVMVHSSRTGIENETETHDVDECTVDSLYREDESGDGPNTVELDPPSANRAAQPDLTELAAEWQQRLAAIESFLASLAEQKVLPAASTAAPNGQLMADQLRDFEQSIGRILMKHATELSIGNARIANLQEQLEEMEKNILLIGDSRMLGLQQQLEDLQTSIQEQVASQLQANEESFTSLVSEYSKQVNPDRLSQWQADLFLPLMQKLDDLHIKASAPADEGALGEIRAHIEKLTNGIQELADRELHGQKEQNTIEQLQASLTEPLEQKVDLVNRQAAELRQRLEQMQSVLAAPLTQKVDFISQQAADLHQKLEQLQSNLDAFSERKMDLEGSQVVNLRQQIEQLQSVLAASVNHRMDLIGNQVADLRQRFELLQSELAAPLGQKIDLVSNQTAHMRQGLEQLQSGLAAPLAQKMDLMSKETAEMRQGLKQLQVSLTTPLWQKLEELNSNLKERGPDPALAGLKDRIGALINMYSAGGQDTKMADRLQLMEDNLNAQISLKLESMIRQLGEIVASGAPGSAGDPDPVAAELMRKLAVEV